MLDVEQKQNIDMLLFLVCFIIIVVSDRLLALNRDQIQLLAGKLLRTNMYRAFWSCLIWDVKKYYFFFQLCDFLYPDSQATVKPEDCTPGMFMICLSVMPHSSEWVLVQVKMLVTAECLVKLKHLKHYIIQKPCNYSKWS